jgi:hypothetical protein
MSRLASLENRLLVIIIISSLYLISSAAKLANSALSRLLEAVLVKIYFYS